MGSAASNSFYGDDGERKFVCCWYTERRKISPGKGFLVSAAGPVITGASGLLVMLISALLNSEHLVFAGEILSMNLLGMTTLAADGRKAVRNLALVLDPPDRRGVKC